MNENVVISFEAKTDGIDVAKKKLDELGETQKKNSEQFKKNQKEEAEALIKTNGALNVLEANLKSLRDDRQKAFDPKAIKEFNIQIAESERAINKLKSAGIETGKGFDHFQDSIKEVAVALGLAFSIEKVLEFRDASIEAFEKAENAGKELAFAVKNISGEGADALENMKELAEKLSSINGASIFSPRQIQETQTQLLNFGLTTKEVEKLLPNLLNAASVTEDLTGTTDRFLRAIDGQTKGLRTLGVDFRDTGNKLENYNKLIDQTNKFTGESAIALQSASGQAKAYENQIEVLQESLGSKLAPAINRAKAALLEFASDVIDSFASDDDKLTANLKVANAKRLDSFREYNDALRKAAAEENDADIAKLKKDINDLQVDLAVSGSKARQEEDKKEIEAAKIKLEAAVELKKQFDAIINPPEEVASKLKDTEEEIARKKAAREAAAKQEADDRKKLNDEIIALRKKLSAEIEKIENDDLKDRIEKNKAGTKAIEEAEKELVEKKKDLDKLFFEHQDADQKKELQRIKDTETAAIQSAQAIADALFQISANNRNAQLNADITAITKKYDAEIENKKTSDKQKKILEEKRDREIAKLKTEAWKKDRDAQAEQAAIAGAVAFVEALPNYILAAAVAVATAAQIAVIESQPVPQFAKGTKHAPKGWAWVGEEGPELVQLRGGEEIKTHRESVKFAALQFPDLHIAPERINVTTKGSIDYDRLADALTDKLTGLDDLRKLNETNHLLYIIASRMNNNNDIRRN